MPTQLLIDGYNLLFASDVFASPAGPPTLERTRNALLQFLAAALEDKLRGRTVVVFDATQAPPGLPHESTFADLRVLFSRRGQEADDLLEDLIAAQRAPRELLVVSSDHRVQRAARQRGAKFADSDAWLRELRDRRQASEPSSSDCTIDPLANSAELQKWLAEFGDVDSRELTPREPPPLPRNSSTPPATLKPEGKSKKRGKPIARDLAADDEKPSSGSWNPFPPGYADDLMNEDSQRKQED